MSKKKNNLADIARELDIPISTVRYWTGKFPGHFSEYEKRGASKLYDHDTTTAKIKLIQEQLANNNQDFIEISKLLDVEFKPIFETEYTEVVDNNEETEQRHHNNVMVNMEQMEQTMESLKSLANIKEYVDLMSISLKKTIEENETLKNDQEAMQQKIEELDKERTQRDSILASMAEEIKDIKEQQLKKKKGFFSRK